MWMNHVMQDDRGNWYGWGRVLDYIGVEWRDPEAALLNPDELPGQMIFDGMREQNADASEPVFRDRRA